MKHTIATFSLGLSLLMGAGSAQAALDVGTPAPDFTVQAALAGKTFDFSLEEALKKGPVVLYFYPAAFTEGCTIEAHTFAEAIDEYAYFGATVIGLSSDNIDVLKDFSTGPCGSKFAVGADTTGQVIKAYDAGLGTHTERAARMSYVISPEGKIVYEYTAMDQAARRPPNGRAYRPASTPPAARQRAGGALPCQGLPPPVLRYS